MSIVMIAYKEQVYPGILCELCGKQIKDGTQAVVFYCRHRQGLPQPDQSPFTPAFVHSGCAYPVREGQQFVHIIDKEYECVLNLDHWMRHLLFNTGMDVNTPKQLKKLQRAGQALDEVCL